MNRMKICAGAALLALGACGEGQGIDPQANPAAAAAGNIEGDHEEAADRPTLLLDARGIMPGGTAESMIAFGTVSGDTIERVKPLLGADFDQDSSAECGAGPMDFANWGNVVIMSQQGRFVGWELREASEAPWIGTPGGATIGSPRRELEAAFATPLAVEESTLGIEFEAGGFHGLLSDNGPTATVTALWAGTNCVMR